MLDEPTVGVDPQSATPSSRAVEELASEGHAVLYTTHYMEEAERLCDRVGIIDDGRSRPRAPGGAVALVGERDRVPIAATRQSRPRPRPRRAVLGGVESASPAGRRNGGARRPTPGPCSPSIARDGQRTGTRITGGRGQRAGPRGGLPAPHRQGVAGLGGAADAGRLPDRRQGSQAAAARPIGAHPRGRRPAVRGGLPAPPGHRRGRADGVLRVLCRRRPDAGGPLASAFVDVLEGVEDNAEAPPWTSIGRRRGARRSATRATWTRYSWCPRASRDGCRPAGGEITVIGFARLQHRGRRVAVSLARSFSGEPERDRPVRGRGRRRRPAAAAEVALARRVRRRCPRAHGS